MAAAESIFPHAMTGGRRIAMPEEARYDIPNGGCDCGVNHWVGGSIISGILLTTRVVPIPIGLKLDVTVGGTVVSLPIVFDGDGRCIMGGMYKLGIIEHGGSVTVSESSGARIDVEVSVCARL
jgi:hypothetical protein